MALGLWLPRRLPITVTGQRLRGQRLPVNGYRSTVTKSAITQHCLHQQNLIFANKKLSYTVIAKLFHQNCVKNCAEQEDVKIFFRKIYLGGQKIHFLQKLSTYEIVDQKRMTRNSCEVSVRDFQYFDTNR